MSSVADARHDEHEHERALGRGVAGDEEQADAEGEVAEVHRLDAAEQHEAQRRHREREHGVEVAADGHRADPAGVGEQPERQPAGGGEHGLQQDDAVAVPAAERADAVEEQHPEDHPHEVVDRHDQHLDGEGAPAWRPPRRRRCGSSPRARSSADHLRDGARRRGTRPSPPTASTPIQNDLLDEQPRLPEARREARRGVGHRPERQEHRDALDPSGSSSSGMIIPPRMNTAFM